MGDRVILKTFIRQKYFIYFIIKIFVFLVAGYALGLFSKVNQSAYEAMIPYLPVSNDTHKEITLVNVSNSSAETIDDLIKTVTQYHPRMLLVDLFHQDVTQKTLFTLYSENNNTVFMMPAGELGQNGKGMLSSYHKHSEFFKLHKSKVAFYHLDRLQKLASYAPSQYMPEFDPVLIMGRGETIQDAYIDYNGNPSYAKLYADDVTGGNYVPGFFEDKIVLLSNYDNIYAVSSLADLFSDSFIHQIHLATFVKSILSDNWLYRLSIVEYILCLSMFAIIWSYIVYLWKEKYVLLVSLSFVLPVFLYWTGVVFFKLFLPFIEMTSSSILITFFLFKHWQDLKQKDESSLLINIAKRLQEKVVHKTFFNSDESWKELNSLINQLFQFKKNILFEKLEGDTRINEIISYNCSFSDIEEMRRDYTREPYTVAIENKKITKPNRKFFNSLAANEEEYIVPLLYNNLVVGFWAFTLDVDEVGDVMNYESVINSCAKEISELIYKRKEFLMKKDDKEKRLERLMNMEVRNENMSVLKSSLSIIEKRMLLTETIFDHIYSKVIIYDLFGKIVQLNEGMNRLLQSEEIPSHTLTAGEMLSTLTEIDLTEAKELIREVTLTETKDIRFIHLKNSKKKYLLTISSITKDDIAGKFSENYIFNTFGVLFELVDLSFIERNYKLKQNVIERSQKYNKERLDTLTELVNEIYSKKMATDMLKRDALEKTIHDIVFSNNKLSLLMDQRLDTNKELYPMDILRSLRDMSEIISAHFNEKQIGFEIKVGEELPLVLAPINDLESHLYNLLHFLVNDSEEGGTLSVNISVQGEYIQLHMRSNGFGVAEEQFKSYLQSPPPASIYQELVEAREDIGAWFGNISYHSNIGEGVVIDLFLLKVEL